MALIIGIAFLIGVLLVYSRPSGGRIMYIFAIIFRIAWSLTVGLVFFPLGLVGFLLIDILKPESNNGYVFLTNMYKWGSGSWFKGLKMETDEFDLSVAKQRKKSDN